MAAPATAPSTPPSARPPAPAASDAAALPRAHDETGRAAGPEGLLWGDLTWDERRAAAWLGYDEISWDRGEAPPTCMHPWATLTADEQRAASILGYTAATWNAELEQGDAELEQGDAELGQGDAELDRGDAELDQGDSAPDGAFRVTDEADADGANDETFGAGAVDATPAITLPTPLGMALPALSSAAVIPSRTAEIPSRAAEIPSILIDCSSVAAADNPLEMGFLNLNAVRQAQMELLIAC